MKFIRMTHTPDGFVCLETSFSKSHKPDHHGHGTSKAAALLNFCRNTGVNIPDASAEKLLAVSNDSSSIPTNEKLAHLFRTCDIDLRFIEQDQDGVTFWMMNSMTFDLVPWDEEVDDGGKIRVSFLSLSDNEAGSAVEMVSRNVSASDGRMSGRTSVVIENQGPDGPRSGLAMRVHPLERGGFPFYKDDLDGCSDEPQMAVFLDPDKLSVTTILGENDSDCFKIDKGQVEHVSINTIYPG